MKKLVSLVLAMVMILAIASVAAADGVKVGIAAPDVTHGWVAGVAYYAEKYCKDNNLDYKMTVSSDAAEMAANLEDLVVWGANVVVSWPQWAGMETAIQEVIDPVSRSSTSMLTLTAKAFTKSPVTTMTWATSLRNTSPTSSAMVP